MTGFVRNAWSHLPAITLIVSSVLPCAATKPGSKRSFTRLSADDQAALDRLLGDEEVDPDDTRSEQATAISFSNLKTDPGKASLDSVLVAIAKLKCLNDIGLAPAVFQDIPAKFIDQFRQRCVAESIRILQIARVLLTQGGNVREVV
jgi:hypothetical protein